MIRAVPTPCSSQTFEVETEIQVQVEVEAAVVVVVVTATRRARYRTRARPAKRLSTRRIIPTLCAISASLSLMRMQFRMTLAIFSMSLFNRDPVPHLCARGGHDGALRARVHKGLHGTPVDLAVDVQHDHAAERLWIVLDGRGVVLVDVLLPNFLFYQPLCLGIERVRLQLRDPPRTLRLRRLPPRFLRE